MFGSITRLADQKGVDIELGALEEMLSSRICTLGFAGQRGCRFMKKAYHAVAWRDVIRRKWR